MSRAIPQPLKEALNEKLAESPVTSIPQGTPGGCTARWRYRAK